MRERNYAEKLQIDGFGRRVFEEEGRANLAELSSLCRERGIDLGLLHPSYKYSDSHRCVLTEFSASRSLPVLEAHDILHPPDSREAASSSTSDI